MVKTYWQVGRRIVEEEQQGEKRAEYGKQIITLLAEDLSKSYNRGFTARDLRSYRQFYLSFKDLEIWHSRVPNLSWTHFRTMLRVADDNARYWYMREASKEMWSVRTLDRNIASQYYYRLLQSPKKEDVIEEMHQLTVEEFRSHRPQNNSSLLSGCRADGYVSTDVRRIEAYRRRQSNCRYHSLL
jgi:hypothetical protein